MNPAVSGDSALHRLGAGSKLIGLSALCLGIMLSNSLLVLVFAVAVAAALTVLSRLPAAALWQQLRPVAWIVLFALPLNTLWGGLERALLISGRLGVVLWFAALFTLTTPVSAVLDSFDTLSRRVLSPARADRIALHIALVIRSVPLLVDLVRQAGDARKARGAERSLRALAVPVVVRALKSADALGEALLARGADD